VVEAFTRPDIRTIELVHKYAGLVRVLSECREELAKVVAGLSDAEIYESPEVACKLEELRKRYVRSFEGEK